MKISKNVLATMSAILLVAGLAAAQFPMQRPPQFRGVWGPEVGAGAAYQFEARSGKQEIEIAIVGTEKHEGKDAHWMEMTVKDPKEGEVIIKHLMLADSGNVQRVRMIIQVAGQPPMEFSGRVPMMGREDGPQTADVRNNAEHVGTETITTPAGTFTCEHFRAKDNSADVWFSEKVSPWGLVKMTSRDGSMTLTRVISNAKTKIRGTPQKFEMPEMMRPPGE